MTASMLYLRKIDGITVGTRQPMRDIALGNALFFDPNPACLIQIRPVLTSDHPTYGGRPAIGLLWARSEQAGAPDIISYVRLPKRLRKNDRAGIMYAVDCVDGFDPRCGAHFREAAARTIWPKAGGRAWTA